MPRDVVIQQNEVAERVRRIEINRGPKLFRVPAGWDPAYEPLDEISWVAYAMLPFCAFEPQLLPAIPPASQYPAMEMWNNGFSGPHMSRAFMRGMLCCGGLCVPIIIFTEGAGGMKQRVEGPAADESGVNWANSPNSRLVTWDTMLTIARPPPNIPDEGTETQFSWKIGPPAPQSPGEAPSEFNEPFAETFHGHTYAGYTGYSYWAARGDEIMQTLSRGNAGYMIGAPGSEIFQPCLTNQFKKIKWGFRHDPKYGLYDLTDQTDIPACFENPNGAVTEVGFWVMAAAFLDLLAGGYWPVPPRYYMGEPYMSYDREATGSGHLIAWPGWDTWRDRVEEWCFGTPDWTRWVLSWYRAHQPRLSVTGTPSQHWQRIATFLPWIGHVEYRIWQRVMYLRGRLYNPFHWRQTQDMMSLPPGVEPVNPHGLFRVMGSNDEPYELVYQPPGDVPYHRLNYGGIDGNPSAGGYRGRSPQEMIFDGCAIPIKHNPPYVP